MDAPNTKDSKLKQISIIAKSWTNALCTENKSCPHCNDMIQIARLISFYHSGRCQSHIICEPCINHIFHGLFVDITAESNNTLLIYYIVVISHNMLTSKLFLKADTQQPAHSRSRDAIDIESVPKKSNQLPLAHQYQYQYQYHPITTSKKKEMAPPNMQVTSKVGNDKLTTQTASASENNPCHDFASDILCSVCNIPLQHMVGFHTKCPHKSSPKCTRCGCQIIILSYYHCGHCHSQFICQSCATPPCVGRSLDVGICDPFTGLFMRISPQLDMDVILLRRNRNHVLCRYVYSSRMPPFVPSEARIAEHEHSMFVATSPNAVISHGRLHSDATTLSLVYRKYEQQPIELRKIQPKCLKCKSKLILLDRHMTAMHGCSRVHCSVHSLFYRKQKKLASSQRCKLFRQILNERKKRIHEAGFHFTCVQCNTFNVCRQCVLIEQELLFKQTQ